ncbi:hypothetical protein MYIN104542_14220 [Mycobacterium intermedium]
MLRIGKLPADLRAELGPESIIYLAEFVWLFSVPREWVFARRGRPVSRPRVN